MFPDFKASAIANTSLKLLDQKKAEAIILSCDEIFNGRLHGQFVTDLVQGGSGHSMNMNANEVIANRGNEIAGKKILHPNDDINMSQSFCKTAIIHIFLTNLSIIIFIVFRTSAEISSAASFFSFPF